MCEPVIFNIKSLKSLNFIKLLIQLHCIWLSGVGVLFVVVVCGYKLPVELVCSVCIQIINLILMGSLGTSFGKCHFHYTYLVMSGVLICSVLCFLCGKLFLFVCPESFVIFLTSLPLYVKAAHFVMWCCGSVCLVFCFYGTGCFLLGWVILLVM
jgi:hypothetical protein